jgi:hypothetical protein
MKSTIISQNKNSAGAQPSMPAVSSNQTATVACPSRAEIARSAYALYLTQGASSVSMKLITERASITTPVPHEILDERYMGHAHGGLND